MSHECSAAHKKVIMVLERDADRLDALLVNYVEDICVTMVIMV